MTAPKKNQEQPAPRISVIGTGYLGATHAVCMVELGYDVIGLDVDQAKIDSLKAGIIPFFEALAKPENDDIIGFSWFNLAVTSYVEGVRATNDWRIDSRADSLSAFITGLTRPEDHFTLTPAP